MQKHHESTCNHSVECSQRYKHFKQRFLKRLQYYSTKNIVHGHRMMKLSSRVWLYSCGYCGGWCSSIPCNLFNYQPWHAHVYFTGNFYNASSPFFISFFLRFSSLLVISLCGSRGHLCLQCIIAYPSLFCFQVSFPRQRRSIKTKDKLLKEHELSICRPNG